MGCKGDRAVKIGIRAQILLWGVVGGGWGVRVRVRFLLFYSELALTGPWRGVLRALLGRGGMVWGARAMPGGHSLRHFPNVS